MEWRAAGSILSANVRRARARRQPTAFLVLAILALADPAAAASRQDASSDAVVRELAAFLEDRDGTLEAWLDRHPDARWETHPYGWDRGATGDWCARVTDPLDADGTVRRLYFYPPPRAGATTLPEPRIAACRLGSIRIERPEPDSAAGTQDAEATITAVERRFGPGTRAPHAGAFVSWHAGVSTGHDFLQNGSRWRVADATLVVGYNDVPLRHDPGVVAFAFIPASTISLGYDPVTGELAEAEWERNLDRRFLEAAADAGLTAARTVAAARDSQDALGTAVSDSMLLSATEALLAAADTAEDPARRAAAWVAADLGVRLLAAPARDDRPECGVMIVRQLGEWGVDIAQFGACSLKYENNLLTRVIDADPAGPFGGLAYVALLERGWNLERPGADPELFRHVISEGERFLAQRPDSEFRALVHLLVGDAYRDIVALASGLPTTYSNPADYAAEAPAARRAAIDHYRRGLELDPDPALADWAWREAWRLLARLSPTRARFFHIWD